VVLALVLIVFVPFVTVFDFPFAAFFLGVIFDRAEAFFVTAFFFGLDVAPTLAFLGLALGLAVPFLDTIFFALTDFFDTALDFVANFFLGLGRGLAFDLGLPLAAMCHPPDRMIDNRPAGNGSPPGWPPIYHGEGLAINKRFTESTISGVR
jgi:hypothetical protein